MVVHCIQSSIPYDSNIYLVVSDRTMLVDSGTGEDRSVVDRIKSVLAGRNLDMIVATHCHYDHIGGMGSIAEEFGCEIYAESSDARHMRDADSCFILSDMFDGSIQPMRVNDLKDGQTIDLGGLSFEVIWTPGHTEGSICLYDRSSQMLISGDTLFQTGFGRTDFPGGSTSSMRSSLIRLSNIDIRELYPGHGSKYTSWNRSMMDRILTMVGV